MAKIVILKVGRTWRKTICLYDETMFWSSHKFEGCIFAGKPFSDFDTF